MRKLLIIAIAVALVACKEQFGSGGGAFTEKEIMGMYDAGAKAIFTFDRDSHQIVFSPSTLESMVQDDAPNVLFLCRLDKAPDSGGDITLTLSGRNVADQKGTYIVRLVKSKNGYVWLKDERGNGFVLYWDK